ncbi:MAG: PHP domain-containing protein [Clostridia bacterium]|nr:PHP domain-containing protein [Clostridia bacterium]
MSLYRFDTHVHTSETSPCGRIDGAMVARLYKHAGYDGIVITDHYCSSVFNSIKTKNWAEKVDIFLEGYRNAYEEGQRIGLKVILGIELCFDESFNDYLVYGIDEVFLKEHPRLYELGLKKFREFVKDRSILIYQAHPYRSWVAPADPKLLDGVEVFNGNPRHNSKNHRALGFAKENKLKMLSGSDFHQKEDLALGGIVLSECPADSKEFAQLLRENKVVELLDSE